MMFSRSAIKAICGYDPDFYFSQDLELQLRLAAAGYDMCSVDEVIYHYRSMPQQLLSKASLQSEFRAIANKRFQSGDWSIQVPLTVSQAAREVSVGDDQSADRHLGDYWYTLALISALAFRPVTTLGYVGASLRSGNRGVIAKLLVKLPWNLLISSWATPEGRRTS